MRFSDNVPLNGVRMTDDGYLVATAKAVRTGIQVYRGSEVGLVGDDANRLLKVYRSEDEVRAPDSLRTFSHAPITMDHPAEPVTPANWKDLAKGEVSTDGQWVDNHIALPLIIKDADAIAAVQAGKRQLSAGYDANIVLEDGVAPDGTRYDAVQKDIRINHLAIVERGRAGTAQIGDSAGRGKWGVEPVTVGDAPAQPKEKSMNTRTIFVDKLPVEVTDAAAHAIEKLQGQLADAQTTLGEHTATIATRDTRIGELEAENKALQDAALDDAAIEARVAARAALVDEARTVVKDYDSKGKSEAAIRRDVVAAKMGDAAVKDANDDTIKGMYKVVVANAVADAKRDPLARHMAPAGGAPAPVHDAAQLVDEDAAYAASVASLNPTREH